MNRYILFLLFPLCVFTCFAKDNMASASGGDKNKRYVSQYSGIAVTQMERYGVPASITLAQGILESGAGMSKLSRQSNNHFGIKCHRDWKGPYVLANDDRPNEKFRKYKSVGDSYEDHSRFLKANPRYSFLFEYEVTDYRSWAHGLKSAGYATSPSYAMALINLIERYGLYQFDKAGSGCI